MRLSKLTLTVMELNAALDTGKYDQIPMSEARERISAGDFVRWLRERVPDASLSFLTDDDVSEYESLMANIWSCYGGTERRKWGVERRALCLLIAWTNEMVQQRMWKES